MNLPEEPAMYVNSIDAVLNSWFKTYDEARAALKSNGGYLFPFKNQFFITSSEGVRELGLDPSDPDWTSIDYDWVNPKDRDARERLRQKRLLVDASRS